MKIIIKERRLTSLIGIVVEWLYINIYISTNQPRNTNASNFEEENAYRMKRNEYVWKIVTIYGNSMC